MSLLHRSGERLRVIEQSTPNNTILFNVTASDRDQEGTVNAEVTFSLPDPTLPFQISADNGMLVVSGYLSVQTYIFEVMVTDKGTPSLNSSESFMVEVVPNNDNAPVFQGTPYTASVLENTPAGISIFSFTITDADPGNEGRVNLTLVPSAFSSNVSLSFSHTPSGTVAQLNSEQPFDRETLQMFTVNVSAFDTGNVLFRKTSETEIIVTIADENDNDPMFVNAPYQVSVAENATMGFSFLQLNASDADIGFNANLSFSLLNGTDTFGIDSKSGWLIVEGMLLQARVSFYILQVQVRDQNGAAGSRSQSTIVTVDVVEVNDNVPQFVFPLPGMIFTVAENASNGTFLLNVNATDADAGSPGEISLSIAEEGLPFAINGTSVVVSSVLDYEVSKTLC